MTIAGLVGLAVENRKDEKRRVLLKEIKDATELTGVRKTTLYKNLHE